MWGALSFGYFSLSTQRKVTRSPGASENPAWMPRDEEACSRTTGSLITTKNIAPEGAPT
jgi:hypothetical protein